MFQDCLVLQETSYEESQAQMHAHPDEGVPAQLENPATEEDMEVDPDESDEEEEVEDDERDNRGAELAAIAANSTTEGDMEMKTTGLDDNSSNEGEAEEKTVQTAPQEDQWASIIEPVTADSLLDTLLACLETLTSFSNLLATNQPTSPKTFSWLEKLSTDLLNTKLPAYLSLAGADSERCTEVFLTRANFLIAFADVTFRAGGIDIPTYSSAIEDAFSYESLATTLPTHPEGLCNKAEALISFNQSLRLALENQLVQKDQIQRVQTTRWKALTAALTALTTATKLPDAENVVKMHLARGDVELLRYQLGRGGEEIALAAAAKNAPTLLKNAGTYYRGSIALAKQHIESWADEYKEAVIKEGVVQRLAAGNMGLSGLSELVREGLKVADVERVVEDMAEEGLISVGN